MAPLRTQTSVCLGRALLQIVISLGAVALLQTRNPTGKSVMPAACNASAAAQHGLRLAPHLGISPAQATMAHMHWTWTESSLLLGDLAWAKFSTQTAGEMSVRSLDWLRRPSPS